MLRIANEQAQPPGKNEDATNKPEEREQTPAELREQMLRLAAEFDNYKKRVRKDIDSAEAMGKASLIMDLLPIIDEFELAILALNGMKDKNLMKGIELLYSNFMDTLKKEGLEEVEVGGAFDPYKHETVMVRESDDEDGKILEVVKKGYMFENKLLRPATIIIAKHKMAKDNKNDNKKE